MHGRLITGAGLKRFLMHRNWYRAVEEIVHESAVSWNQAVNNACAEFEKKMFYEHIGSCR